MKYNNTPQETLDSIADAIDYQEHLHIVTNDIAEIWLEFHDTVEYKDLTEFGYDDLFANTAILEHTPHYSDFYLTPEEDIEQRYRVCYGVIFNKGVAVQLFLKDESFYSEDASQAIRSVIDNIRKEVKLLFENEKLRRNSEDMVYSIVDMYYSFINIMIL